MQHRQPVAGDVAKRLVLAALCVLLSGGPSPGQQRVDLSLPEARRVAQDAVRAGNPELAASLARGLLRADAEDAEALAILATADLLLGRADEAERAARRAFALARTPATRHEAARLVALSVARQERYTLAQVWLRRALNDAPTPEAVARTRRDLRGMRALSPWSGALGIGIAPSSNVNGGSASLTTQLPLGTHPSLIDFLTAFGLYDPATDRVRVGDNQRALPGLQVSADAALRYRLRATGQSATHLEATLQGRTYRLGEAARDILPDARGSDFADAALGFGLRHRWTAAGGTEAWTLGASLGQSWYGGAPTARHVQVTGGHGWSLSESARIDLSGLVQWQDRLDGAEAATLVAGQAAYGLRLRNGDRMSVSLELRDNGSERPDTGHEALSLGLRYDLAAPLGPLRLGVGVQAEERRYDRSLYGTNGRRDLRTTARLDIGLPGAASWGFEPTVTAEATRNASDVGLFESEELKLGFGLRSWF